MIIGAIDIGGTKISVGLVEDTGRLLDRRTMLTQVDLGLPNSLERIVSALKQMGAISGVQMAGIGIGCTGPVDPLTGELSSNSFLTGWEGQGLVNGLKEALGVSVAMENDADAAALAEAKWGSGKGCQSFIYVTIGTGIGGGVIVDGKLYRGAGGAHPEIGHQVIDPSGPACVCGSRGCWESLASGPALARWYLEQLPRGQTLPLNFDARHVCSLASAGSDLAGQAVERTANYIGIGLANLVTIFAPERIALGGGLMNSWRLFEATVQQVIRQNCGLVPYERTAVGLAHLGPDTGLFGAAQAWLHRQKLAADQPG